MSLPVGAKLGPYEIVGLLGAGGMGEVYRAKDLRLGRDVAIKTLPPGLAGDGERLRRFETEARAASVLSHPNILTVFDVGTADGQPYIVSELLEGENLRERLQRGPLSPPHSVEIAAAIAGALAAAHERGIVHRDLKPENLFLTRDGRLKILDFGVAKLTLALSDHPGAEPTVTLLTDVGIAVGTLGYMSPEQVRGQPVDARSDIFALGAILHEMITGTPVFRSDSRIQTINAVLEAEPAPLPDTTAPAIRHIVNRCLEKKADDRFQTARDLAFALRTLSGDVPLARGSGPSPIQTRRRINRWTIAATALLASGATVAVLSLQRTSPRAVVQPVKRFVLQPPAPSTNRRAALSSDGRSIVYVVPDSRGGHLQLRQFAQSDSEALPGTDGAYSPAFSPDGTWIAFAAQGLLKKIAVAGGPPITICNAYDMLEADWGPDGQIVFASRQAGLKVVPADGGTPQEITTPNVEAGEIDHHAPSFLPGGRALLFTIHAGPDIFRLAVRSLDTSLQRTLLDNGFDARFVPSGHILYGVDGALMAAPFDLERLSLAGPSVAVVEDIGTSSGDGVAWYSTALDGTLAYIPAARRTGRTLQSVDRTGHATPLPTPPAAYDFPALSPDGKQLAVQVTDGARNDVYVYDFAADRMSRVTLEGAESRPVWSPDGRRLTYSARRNEERHILWQPPDASSPPRSIVNSTRNDLWAGGWTAGNEGLVFVEAPPTSLYDIKLVHADKPGPPDPIAVSPGMDHGPVLSPDGRWVAYTTYDSGVHQVYVRPLEGGTPRQISTDGGTHPRWGRSGSEILYRRRGQIVSVGIRMSPTFTLGKPEVLFDDVYVSSMLGPANYDVTADGQRFIFVKPAAEEQAARSIRIVENWIEELKTRVAVPH